MSPSNALNLLFRMRGRTFHPRLVEQFIRCIGYFPVGSVVELNSGEIGVVVTQNAAQRLQPKVMVVRDARGQQPHGGQLFATGGLGLRPLPEPAPARTLELADDPVREPSQSA